MAAIKRRLGDFQGPQEERAFDHMAANLPDSWYVIANRVLDTPKHEEVDFFVLGENTLFILEEKSWGPKVIFGDSRWTVINAMGETSERPSPFRNLSNKAKVTAGWLREKISGFNNIQGRPVVELVLLTHPKIEASMRIGVNDNGAIFELSQVCDAMLEIDARNQENHLIDHRDWIAGKLLDVPPRQISLPRIKNFKVTELISRTYMGNSPIRTYAAESSITHKEFHLQCHHEADDSKDFIEAARQLKRNFDVAEKLFHTQRMWKQSEPFFDDENDFVVYPYEKPPGAISLEEISHLPTEEFLQIRSNSLNLVRDGLAALSDLASNSIFHRTLTDKCIWIAQSSRILLSDFFVAHNNGTLTTRHLEDAEENLHFRAPEAKVNIFLSDAKSDLYSFCKIISQVLRLDESMGVEDTLDEASRSNLLRLFKLCLQDDATLRPSAIEALGIISPQEEIREFVIHETEENTFAGIFGRDFEVIERLGEGVSGVAWKARYIDAQNDALSLVAIKSPYSEEDFEKLRIEHSNGVQLRRDCIKPGMALFLRNCSIGREVRELPAPGFIVNSFMQGIKLKEFKNSSPSVEDYSMIFLSALDILEAIHSASWIHGDISPNNVLVEIEDLSSRFIDFGEARRFGKYTHHFGTQSTYAPEVAQMNREIDGRADLYSLAATFIYIILGRHHRNLLGDTPEFFVVNDLMDHEKYQFHDVELNFIRILFEMVNPNPDARPTTSDIRERIANYQTRYVAFDVVGLDVKINNSVDAIRAYYTASEIASTAAIAEFTDRDAEIASIHNATYVPTLLETELLPEILDSKRRTILLTGNPGGGKTAFLLQVKNTLLNLGGKQIFTGSDGVDNPEWKIEHQGVLFHAVLDASQSIENRGADAVVADALRGVEMNGNVALIAINDGRLRQFTRLHEEEFRNLVDRVDDYFLNSEKEISEEVIIVDLKNRAVVDLDGQGFLVDTIQAFTADALWKVCGSCKLQEVCPINQNRIFISTTQVQKRLAELVHYTYLRKIEKPNFRRIKSAIAFLITGDRNCAQTADALRSDEDLTPYEFRNLMFGNRGQESLIKGWNEFDPALRISPNLKSGLRPATNSPVPLSVLAARYRNDARKAFFAESKIAENLILQDTLSYQFYVKYLQYLRNDETDLIPILHGLSRICGAHLAYQGGLALTEVVSSSGWVVMKIIPEDSFIISVDVLKSRFLETTPQSLSLVHRTSGRKFSFSLDAFELIFRAADGEIFNDFSTSALRFEMKAFASSILRSPASEVHLLNPSGGRLKIQKNQDLIYVDQSEAKI